MSATTNLLTLADWSAEKIEQVLDLALDLKKNPAKYNQALAGKSIATIYEKPSLRTRVSFDVGINKLGGHAVYLDQQNGAIGKRESVRDFAQNLSCWVDAIVARVFDHSTLEKLVEHSSVPVINSLCNLYHPCQGLADMLSLKEKFGNLKGIKLAYVGDGNNVTHSLLIAGAKLGMDISVVTPIGHGPDIFAVQLAEKFAKQSGGKVVVSNDMADLAGHDAVYADTWISMGDNVTLEQIADKFMPYQITSDVMATNGIQYFMHCQPVHRGEEATAEVVDGEQSIMIQQAENRMHAQNAVMITLVSAS